jgi:hypothetical protein
MQNIYSYQLIVELEVLQPSGLYIHEQMYIAFLLPSYHHHLEQHTTRCTSGDRAQLLTRNLLI